MSKINATFKLNITDPAALPAWFVAANAGEWTALPNSTLTGSGVGWAGTPPGGTSTYISTVKAWSGGILNTVGVHHGGSFIAGTFLVIFGGGHGDYGGNELYAYGPLESDSPVWRRLIDPSIPAPVDVARLNGYPVSRHTYDSLVYLPTLNKMLCIGSAGYYNAGFGFNVCDVFDFSVDPSSGNPWSTRDTDFPAYGGGGAGTINIVSGYNPLTGKAWGLGKGNGQRLGVFDAATETWASYAKDNPIAAANSKAAVLPAHNLLVLFSTTGTILVQDLSSPTSAIYAPTITGTGPGAGNNMLEWDEAGGRFVAWARTGKTIYFLTPGANPASGGDAWAWESATPAGGATPGTPSTNGTYGRFRVVDAPLRGVMLMPYYDQPIHFYKPTS